MRRILVTGGNGQVGWELRRALAPLGEVVAPGRELLDLARPQTLHSAIAQLRPALIVNPAAYTAVDKAEAEPELARLVNGEAPGVLAEAAARLKIPLIHYSTDYVFDGRLGRAYRETDTPNPQSVYGATKQAGEEAIAAVGGRFLILRTSWVYGLRGKNFLLTMLRLGREREEVGVVSDQFGAPTWSRLIAEASAHLAGSWLRGDEAGRAKLESGWGTYHLCAGGHTSWHGFTAAIFAHLQRTEGRAARLKAIATADYPTPAQRPANSRLDCAKLRSAFELELPDWQAGLDLCLEA